MPSTAIITQSGRSAEEITAAIRIRMKNMVSNALEIGLDLIEMKDACKHGEWGPWLKEVGLSASTAANYMRIAKEVSADSKMAQLPYTKILALMAAPPEEREELAEIAGDMSAAQIRKLTEERNKAAEAANSETARAEMAEADAKRFYDEAASLRKKLEETEADRHAARCELAKRGEAYERQKRQINELKEKLDEEHGKLLAAENNRVEVEVEKIPEDYERIKRQLANAQASAQELIDAAADAEERANKAEEELSRIMTGDQYGSTPGKTLRVAMTAFMNDCQMMPAKPEELTRDRDKIERSLAILESWCSAMREALESVIDVGEAAVV